MYDDFPVTQGHLLVVPKKHFTSVLHLDCETIADIIEMICYAINYLTNRYRPDGFNIGLNDQQAAGQTVNHLHIHVIPRYENDTIDPIGGIRAVVPTKRKYGSLLKRGKLVRDNIPSIIREKGIDVSYEILDDSSYAKQLKIKLMEELYEFIDTDDITELCDLLEVIICILKFKDIQWSAFETLLTEKRNSNGSFVDRIFLNF